MTLRSRLLPAVDRIRGIRARFGMATIRVKLRVETWTGDINTAGVTASNTDALMSPQPKCVMVGEEVAAFYGRGDADPVTGSPTAAVYEIGPITPEHTSGGYSVLDLLSNTTPTAARRCLVLLAGDGLGATTTTDVLFEIVKVDSSRAFRTMIIVRQAAQTPQ